MTTRGMNEADTRSRLIEPKLRAAGWVGSAVTREFYYLRDHQFTRGRVLLVGDQTRRGNPRNVDYLLRYTDGFPIAVVEAKAEGEAPDAGLGQAKRYAHDLGLAFAYATNGHAILEYDFFTHSSRTLASFPSPQQLWERWTANTGPTRPHDAHEVAEAELPYGSPDRQRSPLLHAYCPQALCGMTPFYFQEVAIRRIITRIMRGQRRVLLAMATGTGKTFVAFQIAWKLIKSGWLQRLHPDRPARILFLADRIVLREQAHNRFSPFADGTSEPRLSVAGHPANLNRDLYFAMYQSLWSQNEQGQRLFECFPHDFFDLVVVDECHRSGFGTWREVLDHFSSAIHLGMTATPKQDENIDTYAYFCGEEPEVAIDPDNPDAGTWNPPAYTYSFGRGIEDGFLATYKVHRVRTSVDRDGLRLEDAVEQGAEVFIPEDVEPRDEYNTPQFERDITLPDRTRTMVQHLAGLLRRFGRMDKTMVFCVDMAHARLVARLLQDAFGPQTGLDNYAVPIISEEGEDGRRALESLADSDKPTPVVATTAELLSTGVDVPPCRNIVFMKTISSPVLFKQIVGRGCRQDPATDKYWFRIIDYTGATRLFDDWDRPPGQPPEPPQGPFTSAIEGTIAEHDTGQLLVGASVSVRTGPNAQQGPIRTDGEGRYRFANLPAGKLTLIVNAAGFVSREIHIETIPDESTVVDVLLKRARQGVGKIKVEGLEVTIADEAIFDVASTGQQLTLEEYQNHARQQIIRAAPNQAELRRIWIDPARRQAFIERLREDGIHADVLARVMSQPEADSFDLLSHIAFGSPIVTRGERAAAFQNRHQRFLQRYSADARRVILELLEKYRAIGIAEVDPAIFSVSPFAELGGAVTIAHWFGGVEGLRQTLQELQRRIYSDPEAA